MKIILDKEQLQITIRRLTHQLIEDNNGFKDTVIIGIQPRGVFLANKIVDCLSQVQGFSVQYGKLDITFYRDDIRKELHIANLTDITFSIDGKKVIIIDDVLYTGRTVRASLDALLAFGRPQKVVLCVLINRRFSRELPIQPDYCGKSIDSVVSEKVRVDWEREEVILY